MTNINGKKIIFVIGGPGSGKGSAIKIQLYLMDSKLWYDILKHINSKNNPGNSDM